VRTKKIYFNQWDLISWVGSMVRKVASEFKCWGQ
jgi:hypothetical protein